MAFFLHCSLGWALSVWGWHLQLEQVKRLQENGTVEHDFYIFWVPRRTLLSNKILEDKGIIGDVNIAEFPLYFCPLEQDVLSLELEDSFSDLYLVWSSQYGSSAPANGRSIRIQGASFLQPKLWCKSNKDMDTFPALLAKVTMRGGWPTCCCAWERNSRLKSYLA